VAAAPARRWPGGPDLHFSIFLVLCRAPLSVDARQSSNVSRASPAVHLRSRGTAKPMATVSNGRPGVQSGTSFRRAQAMTNDKTTAFAVRFLPSPPGRGYRLANGRHRRDNYYEVGMDEDADTPLVTSARWYGVFTRFGHPVGTRPGMALPIPSATVVVLWLQCEIVDIAGYGQLIQSCAFGNTYVF
jgi:hypothetical protein